MHASGKEDSAQELAAIGTDWEVVLDKAAFVKRYARPIHHYLLALTRKPEAAEDVAQEFLLRVTEYGFPRVRRERGRFRNYLKAALRNAALNYLRPQRHEKTTVYDLAQLPAPAESEPDQVWL